VADELSQGGDGTFRLQFACSCTSAAPVADDPWVAIAKHGKLNNGTKERILNAIYRQPRTVAQLAQELGLAAPSVHRHVTELLASELIREVPVEPAERRSSLERYYRPGFPVVRAADRRALQPVLDDLAADIAAAYRARQATLAEALADTGLPDRGERVEALLHYLYATATRQARERLEAEGVLPPWPEHGDGSRWGWWAEERPEREAASTTPVSQGGSDARDQRRD
jgi:DNA-binding transcriptional ArsR family regulator